MTDKSYDTRGMEETCLNCGKESCALAGVGNKAGINENNGCWIPHEKSHKNLMEELYSDPKFPDAVDLWASFFAKDERDVEYSDWRHLNKKRQEIENRVWRRFIMRGEKN